MLVVLLVLPVVLSSLPLADAVSFGNFGSRVLSSSSDFNPQYKALPGGPATICSRDLGTVGDVTDDLWYINIDGAGTVVGAFDVRLTTAGGFSAGSVVGASDSDVGQTFNGVACAAFAANIRFLETDGLPGWTAGDELVWSTDTTLNNGDVRLAPSVTSGDSQSFSAGTVVKTADSDINNVNNNNGIFPDCTVGPPTGAACTSAAVLQGGGSFAVRWFDANLNNVFDTGDTLWVSLSPASTPDPASPDINDVYLAGPSASLGSRVSRSTGDYLLEPEAVCGTPAALTRNCMTSAPQLSYQRVLGTDSPCDRLFIHFREFDGVAGRVLPDDVVLYAPSSGITTCASPPPASSVAPGTRVTSVSTFQGNTLTASTPLAAQIFFVDQNGNGRIDAGDPIYINRPVALGGSSNALTVTAGDFRVTSVTLGSTTFSAGSIVGGSDQDVSTFASGFTMNAGAGQSWFPRKLNYDAADEINLNQMSSVIFHDANADGVWNPGTESVYLDVGTTGNGCGGTGTTGCVNSGDFLLSDGSDGTAAIATPMLNTAINCATAPPTDCGFASTTFKTTTDFRVTGTDTTADVNFGETIYFSKDAYVNEEDFALSAATGSSITAGQVAFPCGNACRDEGIHSNDILYFAWCPNAGCPGRLTNSDVQVAPTPGTRVTSTGTDFVPTLRALNTAGGTLIRYNRGDATSVNDDVFYLSTDGATITNQDVRLTPRDTSTAAGTIVSTSDTEELSATAVTTSGATTVASLIASRDTDGISGYSLGDAVYIDTSAIPSIGTGAGVLSQFDTRATDVSIGGATYQPGTLVLAGSNDLNVGTTFTCLTGWAIGYFDDNLNGVFDSGDAVYAVPPVPGGCTAVDVTTLPSPALGSVRLSGPGGATGNTPPPSPPPSSPPPASPPPPAAAPPPPPPPPAAAPPPPPPPPPPSSQEQALLNASVDLGNKLNASLAANTALNTQISALTAQLSAQGENITSLTTQLAAQQAKNTELQKQVTNRTSAAPAKTPGFEALVAIAGLALVVAARRRR